MYVCSHTHTHRHPQIHKYTLQVWPDGNDKKKKKITLHSVVMKRVLKKEKGVLEGGTKVLW